MRAALAIGGVLLGAATALASAACSDGPSPPSGSGNKVFVDVDATVEKPAPADDGGGIFARVDGEYYGVVDGYSPATVCKSCACASNEFCFGGGPGYTTFSGDCHPTTWGIGCQPLDASPCANDASCSCLIDFLRGTFADGGASGPTCYADCVQNYRAVYCPAP